MYVLFKKHTYCMVPGSGEALKMLVAIIVLVIIYNKTLASVILDRDDEEPLQALLLSFLWL